MTETHLICPGEKMENLLLPIQIRKIPEIGSFSAMVRINRFFFFIFLFVPIHSLTTSSSRDLSPRIYTVVFKNLSMHTRSRLSNPETPRN